MRRPQRAQRGISLIEAVVALAVMAFGMLAYVGLQSTLRFNSDVAKQRSEAVRIAQEAIEQWRAYSMIETNVVATDYAELVTVGGTAIAREPSNTVYTLARTVVDAATTDEALLRGAAPRMKTLVVDVSWQDRNGDPQSVRLSTTIAASPPELAGTLAVPGFASPLQQPLGRSPAIPVGARDMQDGTSVFKPPGAGDAVLWVFDNLTGVIVGVCNTVVTGQAALTKADTQACVASTTGSGVQLSGFVRFSTGLTQPTAADSENPTSTALNVAVTLELTPRTGEATPTHACYADGSNTALTTRTGVPYFCAIFFQPRVVPPPADPQCPPKRFPCWSGISTLSPLPFLFDLPPDYEPWALADNADDARASRYRVCRYTPATSDAQSVPNQLHPRNYTNVGIFEPLTNQNFLVIRAGNGLVRFQCPTDGPVNPATGDFVNSNTLLHQPPPTTP